MLTMIIITAGLTLISLVLDPQKTITGIKRGMLQFLRILPALLSVIIIVSIALHFISSELIAEYLGGDAGWQAYLAAAVLGSVSLIPGFIAYPLAGILLKTGVSYAVLAVFITTLMMVGILTIPIESKYFGIKVTLVRNGLSFIGAIIVGAAMVFIYTLM